VEEHAATVRTDRRRILNRSVIRAPDGARLKPTEQWLPQ
jgi:hypothetical protein